MSVHSLLEPKTFPWSKAITVPSPHFLMEPPEPQLPGLSVNTLFGKVGAFVGDRVGIWDGWSVGSSDGETVGKYVGIVVGSCDGCFEGYSVMSLCVSMVYKWSTSLLKRLVSWLAAAFSSTLDTRSSKT